MNEAFFLPLFAFALSLILYVLLRHKAFEVIDAMTGRKVFKFKDVTCNRKENSLNGFKPCCRVVGF